MLVGAAAFQIQPNQRRGQYLITGVAVIRAPDHGPCLLPLPEDTPGIDRRQRVLQVGGATEPCNLPVAKLPLEHPPEGLPKLDALRLAVESPAFPRAVDEGKGCVGGSKSPHPYVQPVAALGPNGRDTADDVAAFPPHVQDATRALNFEGVAARLDANRLQTGFNGDRSSAPSEKVSYALEELRG